MTTLVRRAAVRLASEAPPADAPPPAAPAEKPAPPADTCEQCGCTAEECKGAGPCCDGCTHAPAERSAEPSTPEAPKASRVRSFIASDETIDRYNTTIRAAGWQLGNFTRNPVILFGHEGRALPIGKGRAWISGTQLRLDIEFLPEELNPVAEQALRILDAGLMGVSVGFDPLEWVYNEERETGTVDDFFNPPLDFTRAELLEVSVVTIPANPSALPVGRDVVEARMFQRANSPGAALPVRSLARLIPSLVRTAVEEVTAELRATRAQKSGRIS